ncbi:mediator complex, subunit Med18, partial [Gorgonomyces haynaldii]
FESSLYGQTDTKSFPKLIDRLISITGKQPEYFINHHIVYTPQTETRFGPERNEDRLLRLVSAAYKDQFIPFYDRQWSLEQQDPPENKGMASTRLLLSSPLEGDVFKFVQELGFKYQFETVIQGFQSRDGPFRLQVFKVYKTQEQYKISTAVPFEDSTRWLVKVYCLFDKPEEAQRWADAVISIAASLDGCCTFHVIDPLVLEHKPTYS